MAWKPKLAWGGNAILFVSIAIFGCNDPVSNPPSTSAPSSERLASDFDPRTMGLIRGRVTWGGPIPTAAPFELEPVPMAGEILGTKQVRPNPNVPVIDAATGGIGNAVIYIRNIASEKSKAWDFPPVRLEMRDCQLHVMQGDTDSDVGFVRLGNRVEMLSRDKYFHSLHADGASFWNFAFPDPGRPLSRTAEKKGLVEFSSAAGYFWMRAFLFVDDHPYYARTDREGRFELTQVPPGCYEVVCWLPNWREARHERDPETGMISRWYFEPPLESVKTVVVGKNEPAEVGFSLATSH